MEPAEPTAIAANLPPGIFAAFHGICHGFSTQALVYGCHTGVSEAKSRAAARHVPVFLSSMAGHVKEVQVVDEAMPFAWMGVLTRRKPEQGMWLWPPSPSS